MSKYEKLLQSLRCRWSSGSGYECGEEFSNACTLTEHLRRRHIPSVGGSQWEVEEGVFECGWEGCGQVILGSHRSYVLHVLGHPYHCFLKLRGSELQVVFSHQPHQFILAQDFHLMQQNVLVAYVLPDPSHVRTQGRIDLPKAGRGHATPVQPVQRAKCWRLLNLEPRFEWYHVRARVITR